MSNPVWALAEIVDQWQKKPLSSEVEWTTRRAVLDWFATTLPGCVLPPATLLSAGFKEDAGTGAAVSYVDGACTSVRHAALLNATASHTVEFDDIFRDGGYHPGSPTVAAVLALAQNRGVSLEAFQRALIAGYEVGCRIALAIQPSHYRYWHTTSTVGTMGVAAGCAALLGGGVDEIAHAISLASSFASGHQQNLQGEGMAKAMHPGHAADAGLMAAYAAYNGVTASPNALFGPNGFAAATSKDGGNWALALDGIGNWTPISRMTVKNHGCCGHIFPSLDGLKIMVKEHGFSVEDIKQIEIAGYGATYSMCNREKVGSAQEARFSIQYCIAALLYTGRVRLDAFAQETMNRDDIQSFMAKVSVTESPELSAEYPQKRMARLRVYLNDGRVVDHFQQGRKGDPEDPLSDQELIEKYNELASTVLSTHDLESLQYQVLHSNELPAQKPFKFLVR